MKSKQWMLNLIFVAIGLGILVLANWMAKPTLDFVRGSSKVQGKVVTNELDWGSGKRQGGYHTIFTFMDPATNKKYRIRDDMRHNPSLYGSGDTITVLYPPGRPEEARIDCFRSLWVAPAITAGSGLAILIFGLIATAIDFFRRSTVSA